MNLVHVRCPGRAEADWSAVDVTFFLPKKYSFIYPKRGCSIPNYTHLTVRELTDLLVEKVAVLIHYEHEEPKTSESISMIVMVKMEIKEIQNEIIRREKK